MAIADCWLKFSSSALLVAGNWLQFVGWCLLAVGHRSRLRSVGCSLLVVVVLLYCVGCSLLVAVCWLQLGVQLVGLKLMFIVHWS